MDDSCCPEVIASRCVHSRIGTASCQACVTACPRSAWVIDDERLGIDVTACDGCDLCIPACPETAICSARAANRPPVRRLYDQPVHMVACQYAAVAPGPHQMPCVHALGWRDLLRTHQQQEQEQEQPLWLISTGDCATCPRGSAPRLAERVTQLNRLLHSRHRPLVTLIMLEAPCWQALLEQTQADIGPATTRRGLFRTALRSVLTTALEATGLEDADEGSVSAPLAAWPEVGAATLFPWVPILDPTRCNGCDACIRLCPHQALTLEPAESAESAEPAESAAQSPAYRIEARFCTGCGICRDVCDQGAVRLEALQSQHQQRIPLVAGLCSVCAAPYHRPADPGTTPSRCRICAHTRRGRQLYQVLK